MFDEISMKALTLIGPMTEADSTYVHERAIKYQLVRFMVVEKLNHSDSDMKTKDFHFSPDTNFMDTPIYDVVNVIVKTFEELVAGVSKPLTEKEIKDMPNS